jgi:hypothetical protein
MGSESGGFSQETTLMELITNLDVKMDGYPKIAKPTTPQALILKARSLDE